MCGSANDILLEFRIIYYLVSHIYSYASKVFFFFVSHFINIDDVSHEQR